MKSTVWKSTFREIKQSLGRYLAILAIVALGVGFFAGLKVTQPEMLETTERYYRENQFYDYRLLSTVGFEEEDVETFRQQEDVKAAEGAVTFDILCEGQDKNSRVLKAHSITEDVNRLVLTAGELPVNADECVVDANLYDASWIGKKIKLSDANKEEDLKHFSYREYKITGIAKSPLYIQFERGNTSLGNGTVSGFIYLPREGFTEDYYTEIYVAFEENFPLYSDAYDRYIDEKTEHWEELTTKVANDRYTVTKAKAETELADGKAELAEKRAEGEAELADAGQQLLDAEQKLLDGEQQLLDAKEELERAPEIIAEKEEQLAVAEQTLREKEAELDMGEIALGVGVAQGFGQISEALNEVAGDGFSSLLNGNGTGNALQGAMGSSGGSGDAQSALSDAKKQIADGRAQIVAAKQELEKGKAAIADAKKKLKDGKEELLKREKELADAREAYETGKREYEEGLAEFNTQIADAEEKIADGEAALAELENPEGYVLGRDTNVGYVCFENDSGIVDGVANVFPVFFFLVAALVCITTMNRMVEEQRTQIGVLKALGYSEWSIMLKYIFYSGSAAVLGCLTGFFGGTILFPKVIWYAYGMLYQVDALVYRFDIGLAVISLVASLVCSVGTTWLSCRYELAEVAAGLMRPKAPKAGKRVIFEYMPFIWKRLKFLQKVSVRNVLRYKKRFFMMIVGISGCAALLVTGFGVRDSVVNVAAQQYTEIQIYDIGVTYAKPVDAAMEQELAAITEEKGGSYALVSEMASVLETADGDKDINLVVLDSDKDMTPFLNLHTVKKEPLAYPSGNQAVISHKLAEQNGIKVGDTVTLRDEQMKKIKVEIGGISQNFVYNYVYLSADAYEAQMGSAPEYKTAYVNVADGEDGRLLAASLMNAREVAAVTVNEDTLARFSSMLQSMNLIVLVIIICAAGLAFIVLYNLTNINITERVREIATIKVLGFYEKETASYVFRENDVLTLIGALVGLVLGHFLHRFVMSQINVDIVAFDVHVRPASYLYSVVLTLLFAWFVNKLMKRKIDRVSMTESLKSVD